MLNAQLSQLNTKSPFRPISSSIGSPTDEVSKYLAHILKFLYNDKYTVQNSKEFSNFIANQKVDPDEYIVSFDVTSLFISIPLDLDNCTSGVKLRLDFSKLTLTNLQFTID